MSKLAPSILSADFARLGEQLQILEDSGMEVLHIDVMDGMFVPSISFGMPVIRSIRRQCELFFDVHLMIQEPVRYIREFADAGANGITVHYESCRDVGETLRQMEQYPVKRAVCINPETPAEVLLPYLGQVDMVLVMGVQPGFGGQRLIPETLSKVQELARIRQEKQYSFLLEFDGGVTQENLPQILQSGVDIVVAGTAVFRGEMKENIKNLQEVVTNAAGKYCAGKDIGNICRS